MTSRRDDTVTLSVTGEGKTASSPLLQRGERAESCTEHGVVVLATQPVLPVRMTDPNSINGLGDLLAFLDELGHAGWTRPLGTVLRLDVDRRLDVYQTLDDALGQLDFPASPVEIPARTAVAKAVASGDPIARVRPDSPAGAAYHRFAAELDAAIPAAV